MANQKNELFAQVESLFFSIVGGEEKKVIATMIQSNKTNLDSQATQVELNNVIEEYTRGIEKLGHLSKYQRGDSFLHCAEKANNLGAIEAIHAAIVRREADNALGNSDILAASSKQEMENIRRENSRVTAFNISQDKALEQDLLAEQVRLDLVDIMNSADQKTGTHKTPLSAQKALDQVKTNLQKDSKVAKAIERENQSELMSSAREAGKIASKAGMKEGTKKKKQPRVGGFSPSGATRSGPTKAYVSKGR